MEQGLLVTIKDIAEQLGVSVSTVGRALADHPRISEETKQRVRASAKELGYIANTAARVMRGGMSHLVGLLVPDIRSEFYSTVAQSLSKQFEGRGFHLALSIAGDDRDIEMNQVRELIGARAAGIVIVPSAAPRRETLALLKRIPHVQILRRVPSLGGWFGMDDENAIEDAARHLLSLGHKRIGFIGDRIFTTGRSRLTGFKRAHDRAGVKCDEDLIALGTPGSRFGEEAIMRLLPKKQTALITASVLVTLGAAQRLTVLKIPVPDAMSFVGFGDGPWQKFWGPGLTTLRLPSDTIGMECGRWLLQQLDAKAVQSEKSHLAVTPMTLIVRGSTAPPGS
jgi:LacI family transcriptional regulator